MISLIALTDAFTNKFRSIPELVAELEGGPDAVVGYVDDNPKRMNSGSAIYKMPPGSILTIWQETTLTEGESMEAWIHRVHVFVRARRGESAYSIIDALIDGIPQPGDGLRWRYCPLMDGLLPTTVTEIARLTDEEGIDYFVVATETQETGDTE